MSDVTPRWRSDETVAGFASATPNEALLAWARQFVAAGASAAGGGPAGGVAAGNVASGNAATGDIPADAAAQPRLLDLGCGAARNALPLAALGFRVVGLDLSAPMLDAARERAARATPPVRLDLVRAPMAPLPFRDGAFDVVVAHGVWNLARSDEEFHRAAAEAARVARPGAGLFLFTFSRATLPTGAEPVAGERLTFTQFGGEAQVFLTEEELVAEMARAGFVRGEGDRVAHLNFRGSLATAAKGPPVIWQATFRRG